VRKAHKDPLDRKVTPDRKEPLDPKERLGHKVLQGHRDRREHKEPRVQLLVQQTKSYTKIVPMLQQEVLVLRTMEQTLLLAAKSVPLRRLVMKVENSS
jgi:hypothetical protein